MSLALLPFFARPKPKLQLLVLPRYFFDSNHTETLAIHLFSEKNIFLRSRGSLENYNLDYNGHNAPVFRAKRQKTAYSLGRLTRT